MGGKGSVVRLLVADDHLLFRKGLVSVLADWPDLEVVGDAEDGEEAIAKAQDLHPDVILMDINMPGMGGLAATKFIRRHVPGIKILILTVSEQEDDLLEAIKLGANGYLLKNLKPEVLHDMLLAVARGEVPLSPLMAAKMLAEFGQQLPLRHAPKPAAELTSREKEVLGLVIAGAGNKEIADDLCLAPGTVKRHLHNILSKLHARSRDEAASYAVHLGLISPFPQV